LQQLLSFEAAVSAPGLRRVPHTRARPAQHGQSARHPAVWQAVARTQAAT